MSVVVREGSVPIPEDLAVEFGFQDGAVAEWERTEDGGLKLKPALTREEAVRRMRGSLKPYLNPGEDGMEWFLKWRQEERERDYSYQQWSRPTS